MKMRMNGSGWVAFGVLAWAACGDDAATQAEVAALSVEGLPNATAESGAALPVVVRAVDREGRGVEGAALSLTIAAGGGALSAATATTDSAGEARVTWTVGLMPVKNALGVAVGAVETEVAVEVAVGTEVSPVAFGALDAFASARGIEGSTEDLAFSPDGKLVMGVPGGLVAMDAAGVASWVETTGDTLEKPLGLAYDQKGRLWMTDITAGTVARLETDGKVTTVQDRDGEVVFDGPNDLAVGPNGHVYVSDPCLGKVYALDEDGVVLARVSFEAAVGGPNGVVVGPDGALWVATENIGLFCPDGGSDLTAPVGGLFRIPILADGTFGPREDLATNVATFGDGLTFDAEGNLYVLFDTVKDFALDESIVFVWPRGGTSLRRAFAAKDRIWANLAWGSAAFGETTMYLALLAAPPFTGEEKRGIEKVEVGVRGAPLPASE